MLIVFRIGEALSGATLTLPIFDIEKYVIPLAEKEHIFIHTNKGGNWNRTWMNFFRDPANHESGRVLDQLFKMLRDFKISGSM